MNDPSQKVADIARREVEYRHKLKIINKIILREWPNEETRPGFVLEILDIIERDKCS